MECSRIAEQMFTTKIEVVGRPCVVGDKLVQSVDQQICERRHFTTSELSCELQKEFLALFSMRLSQAFTSFAQDEFRKYSWVR
jgi:hypothetical protein